MLTLPAIGYPLVGGFKTLVEASMAPSMHLYRSRRILTLLCVGFLSTSTASAAKIAIQPFYPREGEVVPSAVDYVPFTDNMPVPALRQPDAPFNFQCTIPPNLGPLQAPKFYQVHIKEGTAGIVPGFQTKIWGYDGVTPGPLFRAKHRVPLIVRYFNDLNETNVVTHLHGGHLPAESDGSDGVIPEQVIPPGQFRDFCFPNVAPFDRRTGQEQLTDYGSTLWYHDHEEMVTSRNVYMGLAGFYLNRDELEQSLITRHILPADQFDIPIAIQDKTLDANGQLVFAPELHDFNGFLGDVPVLNGKAQPAFHVQRRKYRFRFLDGSPARFIQLKLSSGQFIQLGSDSWLLPKAVAPSASDERGTTPGEIRLAPAERADVVIDFRNAPHEVFLINDLLQIDGRHPDRVVPPGTPILKFVVDGAPVANDVTVVVGTALRPNRAILPGEIVRTRVFEFDRSDGMWTINGRMFDRNRIEANPVVGSAERWILKNNAGGWQHPIHIHLEAQQLQNLKERAIDPQERFKKDTIRLIGNEEAEIFIRFRTFPGRFVFHCHNTDHEDMSMMARFDVVEQPGQSAALTNDTAITGPDPTFPFPLLNEILSVLPENQPARVLWGGAAR